MNPKIRRIAYLISKYVGDPVNHFIEVFWWWAVVGAGFTFGGLVVFALLSVLVQGK